MRHFLTAAALAALTTFVAAPAVAQDLKSHPAWIQCADVLTAKQLVEIKWSDDSKVLERQIQENCVDEPDDEQDLAKAEDLDDLEPAANRNVRRAPPPRYHAGPPPRRVYRPVPQETSNYGGEARHMRHRRHHYHHEGRRKTGAVQFAPPRRMTVMRPQPKPSAYRCIKSTGQPAPHQGVGPGLGWCAPVED